jgi:hypothetical protein
MEQDAARERLGLGHLYSRTGMNLIKNIFRPAALLAGLSGGPALAQLQPSEVLVVYDSRIQVSGANVSREVAEHYAGSALVPGGADSLLTEAESGEELRENLREVVALHFADAAVRPRVLQMHYVRDELVPVEAA